MQQTTLERLDRALERLLSGKPEKTKLDGKINISRINDEAGLAIGGIYYYTPFIKKAKKEIKRHKDESKKLQEDEVFEEELSELDRIKKKLKDAERLKIKYRQNCNEQKIINDGVVAQNISLAFRVSELEDEVMSINRGKIHRL